MFLPYFGTSENPEPIKISGQWIRINDHNIELGELAGRLVVAEDILTHAHNTCTELDSTWDLAVISTFTTTPVDNTFSFVVYDGMTFKAEPSHGPD